VHRSLDRWGECRVGQHRDAEAQVPGIEAGDGASGHASGGNRTAEQPQLEAEQRGVDPGARDGEEGVEGRVRGQVSRLLETLEWARWAREQVEGWPAPDRTGDWTPDAVLEGILDDIRSALGPAESAS